MKRALIIGALLCASAGASAQIVRDGEFPPRVDYIGREEVEYTLHPILNNGGVLEAIGVELRFVGDADGIVELELPSAWGGETELWRGIEDLELQTQLATMEETGDPSRRVVRGIVNLPARITYRVIQDTPGPPVASHGNRYRPVIQPNYFHLIGEAALIIPDFEDTRRVRVRMSDLPRRWRYASDLQHDGVTLGSLRASVMVGGDFRIVEAPNRHARVAIRGEWSFTDREFAREAGEILAAQRGFWGDPRRPYLVTVLQLEAPEPGWRSIGGTGLADAFAFFATPNADAPTITRTLAHEGLHSWIPGRVGGLPEDDEANEPGDYWFSEGFTEFFTGRLLVLQGVWAPAEFARDFNNMLDAYARTPTSSAPNARVIEAFWTDNDIRRLPYRRGRMMAAIWDGRLRATGHKLDDVLHLMKERAERGDPLDAADMFPLAARELGLDVSADMATHIEAGALITLPGDLFAPCGRVITRTLPNFHRGFDIDATQANDRVISGVDPALPAYAAGLRDGMILLRLESGEIGDPETELVYIVREGEAERTIRYLPRGHGTFTRQELALEADLTGDRLSQCRAVLAGGD